ncbi:hypothetical protein SFRURICE_009983 [Spodoptera frugiperda]|nr:hypothetical protein SFRURICE_009983 [Spodoptera frugiperda]
MGVGSVRPTTFYFACSSVTMRATLLLFSIAGAVLSKKWTVKRLNDSVFWQFYKSLTLILSCQTRMCVTKKIT